MLHLPIQEFVEHTRTKTTQLLCNSFVILVHWTNLWNGIYSHYTSLWARCDMIVWCTMAMAEGVPSAIMAAKFLGFCGSIGYWSTRETFSKDLFLLDDWMAFISNVFAWWLAIIVDMSKTTMIIQYTCNLFMLQMLLQLLISLIDLLSCSIVAVVGMVLSWRLLSLFGPSLFCFFFCTWSFDCWLENPTQCQLTVGFRGDI